MSRRPITKQIYYVRATYNANTAPKESFEVLLRRAMRKLGSMQETGIAMSHLGTVSIRNRKIAKDEPVLLAIGAGKPGEHMTTMGLKVAEEVDTDKTSIPPDDRAFKLSDAYLLIEGNDILLITDGHMRAPSVATYLRMLFEKSDLEPATAAFEFKKVSNQDKQKILAAEGIKEMQLATTMHHATRSLEFTESTSGSGPGRYLKGFVAAMKDLFSEEASNASDKDLQLLAENWAHLQVSTVIKAEGGSRAEEVVLKTIEAVGVDALDEMEGGVDVTVFTRKNTKINMSEVTVTKRVKLHRRRNANDLVHTEVYAVLKQYRQELISQRDWMK